MPKEGRWLACGSLTIRRRHTDSFDTAKVAWKGFNYDAMQLAYAVRTLALLKLLIYFIAVQILKVYRAPSKWLASFPD